MLVATPGQTTSYTTTLHNNNSSNGGGSGGVSGTAAAATSTSKKSTSINSTNATLSGAPKSLNNNNNNNHSASTAINKNSINSNTHTTTASYNYHQNPKINQNKTSAATSSREIISSSVTAATNTHSLKNENSTNNTKTTTTTTNSTTTSTKQQSFIQTLKDSVQKALISTTGGSSINNNSIAHKLTTENKLQNNCNNSSTSIQNVTSSSSSTSHNANKVSTTTTTTSSNNSGNSAAATQSSSSASLVRSKYFSCSLSKLHTVAPTIIHRYPEERQNASSTDSLQKEMCHFKPIRIVPTTPWKSGSKSRGNSLRFPKANLATKNTEFVLKSNCDVNNRKKKQQQNRTQNDKINVNEEDAADDNEQENKEFYGIYKPKPSLTCLSTSVTTPNHQSAFVCLVAQMKSLVNLQSKKQASPFKTVATGEDLKDPAKELFVRKKPARKSLQKKEVEQELPKSRTTRLSSNVVKNINTTRSTTATTNNLKAKSRGKQGRAKSKTVVNMVALAKSKVTLEHSNSMPAVVSKRTRKRKHDDNDEDHEDTKIISVKSLAPIARKSSRLSKDMSSTTSKLFKNPANQNSQQTTLKPTSRKNPKTVVCFSPPLTRSRLKYLAEQGKIITTNTTASDVKKRRN